MPLQALRPTLLGALTPALALLLGLSPQGAEALGLGRPQILSGLGKPLDAVIPLTLAAGETVTDSCVRAEVSAGDLRVPAGLLQLHIEGEPATPRIRLQSLARIDEPSLRITLAVGCPMRLTREFNVFIDPPAGAPVAPPPALPPAPAAAVVVAASPPSAPPEATPAPAPAPKPAVRHRPRAKPRAPAPRLVLERPEVLVSEASSPPRTAASAPDTELTPELEAQISRLKETVAELRVELQARLQAEAPAASAPAPAQPQPQAQPVAPAAQQSTAPIRSAHLSPYRDPMTWLFTLALSLIAGSAAFYGSRWRDQRMRRELAYWRALHAAEGAGAPVLAPQPSPGMAPPVSAQPAPLPDEGQHQATRPQPRPMPWPPAPIAPPAEPVPPVDLSMQATQRLQLRPTPVATAPTSELTLADELLDLQQQVDFLQLLGQHEAAADLLATRLGQGHAGAMTYLMLMELCQQRGDPEVFAELVKQFEQAFRVPAPQWSQSLARGRTLDASASVIAHLQVVWGDPGAAMQMLQDLLVRGGGPGVTSFELPAYRDLLMLYSVARDLFEAGLRGEGVDLMLPLDSSFGPN